MITQTLVKAGQYYDSVTLLEVAQTLLDLVGVQDAAVVMGTPANKGILENAQLLTPEAQAASPDDLVIAVRADTGETASHAIDRAQQALTESRQVPGGAAAAPRPKTVAAAASQLEGANIALISVAGRYAANVAREALKSNLHVFLFSDNVSVEDEVALKQMGRERGLLVMGPDAGTAIINGRALGFANDILTTPPAEGGVGIVAASGTGLQAVTTLLAQRGVGVTQAIGTGGRDLSEDVGGIMMVESVRALQADPATQVLLLVSKPPAPAIAKAVLATLQDSQKPAIVCFLGGKKRAIREAGAIVAADLEKAAVIAAEVASGGEADGALKALKRRNRELKAQASELRSKLSNGQRYYRGLFSGGTFCYETQLILQKQWPEDRVNSNAPLQKENQLANAAVSVGHTAVDLGEDEFTVGRLHPMLDPALRNRRLVHEARDPETAVIYIDVVLGYGVHPNPAGAAVEAIHEARDYLKREDRDVIFLAHVCGTDTDPQNAARQSEILQQAGVIVLPTNAAAARLAAYILR
ncbi:MAG: acyl-CoA synthetase FdrA [Anaerolineae bacterium]|nr:acyl-CoA synthetase FdrA [Anaerolineae bacterium]